MLTKYFSLIIPQIFETSALSHAHVFLPASILCILDVAEGRQHL